MTQICSHNKPNHNITIKLSQLKIVQLPSKNKRTLVKNLTVVITGLLISTLIEIRAIKKLSSTDGTVNILGQ